MNPVFRIDDIGASTKRYNQHGKRRFRVFGKQVLLAPFANIWFFKRIWPFKQWGPYHELTGEEWKEILSIFKEHHIVPVIAVTACWVEKNGTLTPFYEKYPEEAQVLKDAFSRKEIIIANHGLTHCVVGRHLPRFWGSNRHYQREFLTELDESIHREHVFKSQELLERFFEAPITIFVPPGNVWSKKTYRALLDTSVTTVMCSAPMQDSTVAMEKIKFVPDSGNTVAFHDRELKLYGAAWLRQTIKRAQAQYKAAEQENSSALHARGVPNPHITICTVNYNSADFIQLMLDACRVLMHYPYIVIIRDNNSKVDDFFRLQSLMAAYPEAILYRAPTQLAGSEAHGTALNDLVQQIKTPYGVIIDADAVFLLKDWDRLLLERMQREHVPIYGTQADAAGGKPLDFPMIFGVMFETDTMKKLGIDFRPKDREMDKTQDTGWEMRQKYFAANLRGGLLYNFNTRYHTQGPFAGVVCSEFYFSPDASGPLVLSHFGRGSAPAAKRLIRIRAGSNILLKAINKILLLANVMRWKRSKKKWISICRNIIRTQ